MTTEHTTRSGKGTVAAQLSELREDVSALTSTVRSLASTVDKLASSSDERFMRLEAKQDESSKTPWGVLISAMSLVVVISGVFAVGIRTPLEAAIRHNQQKAEDNRHHFERHEDLDGHPGTLEAQARAAERLDGLEKATDRMLDMILRLEQEK